MVKKCSADCKYCNQYNDMGWCECYHPKIKGSKLKVGMDCVAELEKAYKANGNKTVYEVRK